MKLISGAALLVTIVAALLVYFSGRPVTAATQVRQAPVAATVSSDCPQCQQLAARIDELQRNLTTVKSQLASQQTMTRANTVAALAAPADVEVARVADAARQREYMSSVEQAFRNEKADAAWASRTSSKVSATLAADETLRAFAHDVECRSETCRVQINDDGTDKLSNRLPYLAMSIGETLPSISAERVDQGNGRSAMVLYMSAQRATAPAK